MKNSNKPSPTDESFKGRVYVLFISVNIMFKGSFSLFFKEWVFHFGLCLCGQMAPINTYWSCFGF